MPGETIFRNACLAILAPLLAIGIYHRLRARTSEKLDRRQEGVARMVLLRVCGLTMWVSVFTYLISPRTMAWSQISLPPWLRWTGAALGALALPLFYWQLTSLGHNLTDTVVTRSGATLVTHGPYRWVRHPLYSIATLMGLAVALLTASWFIAALWVAGLSVLVSRTRIEEEKLLERFGESYRAYRARTGRFVPRVSSR